MANPDEELRLVSRIGAALISANAPTSVVERTVTRLAGQFGISADVALLPSEVLTVETDGGRAQLMRAKPGSYRSDQTAALFDLIEDMSSGEADAAEAIRRLDRLEKAPPTIGIGIRYLGYLLIIVGLAFNQRPAVPELLVTALLGIVVALIFVTTPRWGRLALLAPLVAAFASTIGISLFVRGGVIAEPSKVLIPLLASLIPGAALSISSLELTQGAISAGASRLMMAVHQLIVLALGVVLALSVLPATFDAAAPDTLLSWWFRPVGVLLYAVGAWLAFSAPRGALLSLVVVLLGAWIVQQVTQHWLSGYTAGFLAGAAGVLIAVAVRNLFRGAPALVTLNPIFRIIAPGGLGLVTVVKGTTGEWEGPDLGTVVFSFLAVAIGMTVAAAVAEKISTYLKQRATLSI